MESLEDIENMRVTELRYFIRRHGYTVTEVPRLDGTPGPPKKADLQRAAKEIWYEYNNAEPSKNSPLRSALSASESNPFQRQSIGRLSSSQGDLQRPHSSSADRSDIAKSSGSLAGAASASSEQEGDTEITNTVVQSPSTPPPRSSARLLPQGAVTTETTTTNGAKRSAVDPDGASKPQSPSASLKMPPSKPVPSSAQHSRRRTHVSINPQFSHLFSPQANVPPPTTSTPVTMSHTVMPESRLPLPRMSSATASNADAPSVNRRATHAPQVVPPSQVRAVDANAEPAVPMVPSMLNRLPDDDPPRPPPPTIQQAHVQRTSLNSQRELNSSGSQSSYLRNSRSQPQPVDNVPDPKLRPRPQHEIENEPDDTDNRLKAKVVPEPKAHPDPEARDEPARITTLNQLVLNEDEDEDDDDYYPADDFEPMDVDEDYPEDDDFEAAASASEFESSIGGPESDNGSVIDTDDDIPNDDRDPFTSWSAAQLRAWLAEHGLAHSRTANATELRPIARAHKMFLDTNAESDVQVVAPTVHDDVQPVDQNDDDRPSGVIRRSKALETTVIDDDDDDDDDGEFMVEHDGVTSETFLARAQRTARRPSTTRKRSARRYGTPAGRPSQLRPPPLRLVSLSTRVYATLLIILGGILVSALGWSVIALYRSANLPYCDTVSSKAGHGKMGGVGMNSNEAFTGKEGSKAFMSTLKNRNFSSPCRPCPLNGVCKSGELSCRPGYVEVNRRCAEDHAFSLYAEALAMEAFGLLRDIAGQAECGHRKSRFLRGDEISHAVREAEMHRPATKLFSLQKRRPAYDELKFDTAMAAALRRLTEDDSFDVILSPDGEEFASNVATLSIGCRFRKFLWANLGRVLLGVLLFGLSLYVRVRMILKRRRMQQVDLMYESAIEVLRTHKEDFEAKMEDYAFVKDVVLRADVITQGGGGGRISKKGMEMWKDVEKRLNEDPRVLRAARTVAGVPSYTFEWAGRRRSGSIGEGLSRRSSFSSRTNSFDSLDLHDDGGGGISARTTPGQTNQRMSFGRFLSGAGWNDHDD